MLEFDIFVALLEIFEELELLDEFITLDELLDALLLLLDELELIEVLVVDELDVELLVWLVVLLGGYEYVSCFSWMFRTIKPMLSINPIP